MTTEPPLRVLACLQCGAPLTVPDAGGDVRCEYCSATLTYARRPAPRSAELAKPDLDPAWTPEERERRRLATLRAQAEAYNDENPYATFDAPRGLEHLELAYDDPTLPSLLAEAFRRAVERCEESRGDLADERRVFWIADKAKNSANLRGDLPRSKAMVETARELVRDAGLQHMLLCEVADLARKEGDLDSAQALVERCDPEAWLLDLDSRYRNTSAVIALERSDPQGALAVLGDRNDDVPFQPGGVYQACMARTAALELLGRHDDADAAFRFNLDELPGDVIRDWLDGSVALAPVVAVLERAGGTGDHAGPGGPAFEFIEDDDEDPFEAFHADPVEPLPEESEAAGSHGWWIVALVAMAAAVAGVVYALMMGG